MLIVGQVNLNLPYFDLDMVTQRPFLIYDTLLGLFWLSVSGPTPNYLKSEGILVESVEENVRMGKTRDLFKKIWDTKGTFHAKMGSIKDRNGIDLTEAKHIKKRRQEYTEELYKKSFMTQIITMVWSLT